jgi:hypothetical protein
MSTSVWGSPSRFVTTEGGHSEGREKAKKIVEQVRNALGFDKVKTIELRTTIKDVGEEDFVTERLTISKGPSVRVEQQFVKVPPGQSTVSSGDKEILVADGVFFSAARFYNHGNIKDDCGITPVTANNCTSREFSK